MKGTDTIHRSALAKAWLLWCAFVVYGSLLPFDLRPVGLDAAAATFLGMPWLNIGLGGRLDWIANLLLYVPMGFLGTLVLADPGSNSPSRLRSATGAALALLIGSALAVSVEFAQIFFAPRTVSLNDLAAEILGSAIGCGGALLLGARLEALLANTGSASTRSKGTWLRLYLLVYLGLSFFPFDFSTALAVLEQKLQRGHAGWWWAPINMQQMHLTVLKLAVEALLTVPFGLSLGGAPRRLAWPVAAAIGLLVGVVIESAQLFLLSATSQGASVLSRAAGFAAGAWLAARPERIGAWATAGRIRWLVAVGTVPWLLMVAYLVGWGRTEVSPAGWMQRAAALNYLPLYYHYYVGEAQALTSLLLVAGIYAWVGVAIASATALGAGTAAVLAFVLAAGFEASRLVLVGLQPDPSNPLIAAAAAWLTCSLVRQFRDSSTRVAVRGSVPVTAAKPAVPEFFDAASVDKASIWGVATGSMIVAAIHLSAGHIIVTGVGTLVFAACVRRYPLSALTLTPILIGLSDVTAYTGQQWLNPLDIAMLSLLALALWHRRANAVPGAVQGSGRWVWIGLVCGLLPSILIAARGASWSDPNVLMTPLDPLHGLLIGKGLIGALVLVLFVRRHALATRDVATAFGRGMCVALAGVVMLTVYERLAFVGPFDFTSDYRAPGPFTEIALGGAYIECFLAAAAPFAVVAAIQERCALLRWAAVALVVGAAYATMVTFSRGGQVVFLFVVFATALLLLGTRQASLRPSGARLAAWFKGLILVGSVCVVAAAVLMAPYATSRFQRLGEDAALRSQHWKEGIGFSHGGAAAAAFGNGLGSFGRESYIQGDPRTRPGMFTLYSDQAGHWLGSLPGRLSYLDQRIDVQYAEPMLLSARMRSLDGNGMQVFVCEKDLVQSRQCGSATLRAPASDQWQRVEVTFTLPANPQAGWPPRPLRLTLFNGGRGAVELDDISLKSADGRELLRNGSFEAASSHWLYSSDQHLTWHLKNLWLQVYFESGWAGVLAHAVLLLCALVGVWRAAPTSGPYCLAFAMALLAFQGVGLIDSVIDSPRFLQLYLSLALLACSFKGTAAYTAYRVDAVPIDPR